MINVRLFALVSLLLLAFGCNKPEDAMAPAHFASFFSGELGAWARNFSAFRLEDFRLADSSGFRGEGKVPFAGADGVLSIYKPILTYSADSSRILDIYSSWLGLVKKGDHYETNADDAPWVILYDMREHYSENVFGGNLGFWIEDVCWISPKKFLVACVDVDAAKNERRPVIVVGDLETERLYKYVDANKGCLEVRDYESAKMKRIPIKG